LLQEFVTGAKFKTKTKGGRGSTVNEGYIKIQYKRHKGGSDRNENWLERKKNDKRKGDATLHFRKKPIMWETGEKVDLRGEQERLHNSGGPCPSV